MPASRRCPRTRLRPSCHISWPTFRRSVSMFVSVVMCIVSSQRLVFQLSYAQSLLSNRLPVSPQSVNDEASALTPTTVVSPPGPCLTFCNIYVLAVWLTGSGAAPRVERRKVSPDAAIMAETWVHPSRTISGSFVNLAALSNHCR